MADPATLLAEAATRLAPKLEVDEVARAAVDELVGALDAEAAGLWISEPGAGVLELRASAGARAALEAEAPARVEIASSSALVGRAARAGAPLSSDDLTAPPLEGPPRDRPLRAALPLSAHGQLVGVLIAVFRAPPDAERRQTLRTYAGLVATFLDGAIARARAARGEARLAASPGGVGHGIAWEADAETLRVSYVSRGAEALLGHPPAAWSDEGFLARHLHPDDRDRVLAALAGAVREDRDLTLEHRLLAADGRVLWFHTGARVVATGPGGTRVIQGLSTDVTALKQAEARMREQLAFTSAVMGSLAEGVYTMDRQGRLSSMNPAAERLLGWTEAELLGRNIHDTIHFQRADGTRVRQEDCPLVAVIESGTSFSAAQDTFTRKDGSLMPVSYTSAPLWRDGQVEGAVLAFRDASDELRVAEYRSRQAAHAALRAEIGVALGEGGTLRGMLQRCAEALVTNLAVAFARAWTLDASGQSLELQASAGLYTHLDGGHARVAVGALRVGRIAAERRPFLTNDLLAEAGASDEAWARREGMRAFAGYPLVVAERLVGVIAIFSRTPLTEATLDLLGSIADALAQGIERRRAEEALRETETRLRRLSDANLVGVVVTEPDGRILDANDAFLAMLGRTREELPRLDWRALTPPEWTSASERALQELRETGRCLPFEKEYFHKDGRRVGALVASASVDETQRRMATLVVDISGRKRAERHLRILADASATLAASLDYEQTLKALARLAVPDLATWCIVDVPTESDRLGVPVAVAHVDPAKEELVRDLRRRFPPDPAGLSGVMRVLRTGEEEHAWELTDEILARAPVPEGYKEVLRSLGLVSYICVPMIARDRVLGAITFVSADPARRYDEGDLALVEELARRAAQAVDNALLYGQAQAAIRLRDEFLAVASHELRTPLTPLLLQLQSLRDAITRGTLATLPRERLARSVAMAERQVGKLTDLVGNLLDVSEFGSAGVRLALEEVDLGALAQAVAARFAAEAARAGAPIAVRAAPGVAGRWDRTRLDQMISHLVSNALKYGAGAPIEIEVSRSGDRARLAVADRGIGIAQQDVERIFGRFERAASVRAYGGLGLGLYIVRQIVSAHRGTIQVESQVGQGTRFTIELPPEGPAPGGA